MPKRKHKSARRDGRGGWVPGKRRHADVGDWSRIRIDLARLLDHHARNGVVSARALAAVLGVSDHTVRRWARGEDRPSPETQERVRSWASEQLARIKLERKANR